MPGNKHSGPQRSRIILLQQIKYQHLGHQHSNAKNQVLNGIDLCDRDAHRAVRASMDLCWFDADRDAWMLV